MKLELTPARAIGHGVAIVIGLAALVAGVEAFAHDMPSVMGATLLVVGILAPVLAWRSLLGSRAAWSFLMTMLGVLAAIDLFGAPKIAGILKISLPVALVLPVVQTIAVAALAQLRGDYRPA